MLIVVGFLFMILIFALVGGLSGTFASFVDLPSALLILVPLVFFLIVSKSGKIIGRYMAISFRKDSAWTGSELEALSSAVRNTTRFILGTGFFTFLVGIIACLTYLGSMERLGPNVAVSLITLLYAIALCFFVFFPVAAWADNKKHTLD